MNPLIILLIVGGVAAAFALSGVGVEEAVGEILPGRYLDSAPGDPFTRFDFLFKNYSGQYDVPWRWIKAICMNESNLGQAPSVARGLANPSDVDGSKSSDGKSWGIMQTTVPTSDQFFPGTTASDLNDPDTSVKCAAAYLHWVMDNYFDDVEDVVRAYNGGPGFKKASTDTYWARFQANMAQVLAQQPGDENEIF